MPNLGAVRVAPTPLTALPVSTRAEFMDHVDEASPDRAVRPRDAEARLENLRGNDLFADRFSVAATSGSSGRESNIPSDPAERG